MGLDAPRVSIVIPYLDEVETLPRLVEALDHIVEVLEKGKRPAEVILVDDGSRDGSWKRLVEVAEERDWLRLVRLRRNYGQTAALSAGFDRARGAYVVPMDGDLQNDPNDIPLLLDKLEEGHDVVSGWRRHRKDPWLTRRLPSTIANWIIARATGLDIHDFGCTLTAYRREALEPVRLYGEMHRFIPVYAQWAGASVTEMEVRHHPRVEGRSKYGLGRTFKVVLDLLTVKFLSDYSTKPLYLFGGAGSVLCVAGVLVGAVTLVQKYVSGAWVHRNPLILLAMMLFLLGIQLLGMGLLAELQVRTYHESQQKATYLVATEVNEPCVASRGSSPALAEGSTGTSSAG